MNTLNIILPAIFVAFAAMFTVFVFTQYHYREKIVDQRRDMQRESTKRDLYLDYVLRSYHLHVADPYVLKPITGQTGQPSVPFRSEKRCFHCNTPAEYGHTPDCPWVYVHPLVQTLYPASPRPTPTQTTTHVGLRDTL